MILVIGNDPQRVDLFDLKDAVYYKQQKFFSDVQYAHSNDLCKAIKAGKVTILQKYGNVDQEFVIAPPSSAIKAVSKDTSKLDLVLEKLAAMEKSAGASKATSQTDGATVDVLLDRIAKLEQRISEMSKSGADPSLTEAVRQLAEKVESSTKDTAILDRLESILDRSGTSGSGKTYTPTRPEEVYVPTVSVEDGNTHIKLDVRSVEAPSGDLDASLAALRKMKSQ